MRETYDSFLRRSSQRRQQDRSAPSPRQAIVLASPLLSAPVMQNLGNSFDAITSMRDQKWKASSRHKEIPLEHKASWEYTKQRVIEAAASVLDTTLDVAHEVIVLSAELLELAPIPGLQCIAKTIIHIWNSLQDVDTNRLQCLSLTGRCAEILISVHQEVQDAGSSVGEELKTPIDMLHQSFMKVYDTLRYHIERPFIQRFLKRDSIQRSIADSHQRLTDALGMFSRSIQIKTLKQLRESTRRGTEAKTAAVASGRTDSSPSPSSDPSVLSSSANEEVLSSIDKLVTEQNSSYAATDAEMLSKVLKGAVAARSDLAMVETLGIEQNEMPDAIETLQHTLQQLVDKGHKEDPRRQQEVVGQEASSSSLDSIDREFLESGIGALRRLSGLTLESPSWTIAKFEVERTRKIGIGFFSTVYRGTWRDKTVAIKELTSTTPRDMFVKEVDIWRKLRHPNILELYGASSTNGDPPWFLVSPYLKEGSLVEFLMKAKDELHVDRETSGKYHNDCDAGLGSKRPTISLQRHELLDFILDIAKGMAYLHDQNVLHGDLKAANVLVADDRHCVITDFGQSDMKSEAYRISGTPISCGTLRWKAPELMSGASRLTTKIDVYAFAVVCFEITSLGKMPWPLVDDVTVRDLILNQKARPNRVTESKFKFMVMLRKLTSRLK